MTIILKILRMDVLIKMLLCVYFVNDGLSILLRNRRLCFMPANGLDFTRIL